MSQEEGEAWHIKLLENILKSLNVLFCHLSVEKDTNAQYEYNKI